MSAPVPPRVKVAIVGLGRMGRLHLDAFRAHPRCVVQAVYDVDPRVPVPADVAVARSCEEAIDAADLLVVSTPTPTHAALVARALERLRHVLVEKPLSSTADESEALVELARRRGVGLWVGLSERFNPAVVWLRDHLPPGLRSLEIRRLGPPPPPRADHGILRELSVHDIDLLAHLSGSPITAVTAEVTRLGGRDQRALVEAETRSGVRARLEASWCSGERRRTLELRHDAGTTRVDLLTHVLTLPDGARIEATGPTPLEAQADAVLRALAGEAGVPVGSGEAGAAAIRALEGAHVRLPEARQRDVGAA